MLLFSLFKVFGHSMEPTIFHGQKVFVSSMPFLFSKPKINDIVAFRERKSGKVFIKRIVKRKEGKYFVRGDNKKDSFDSQKLGWIFKKDIVGKVIYKFSI